MVILPKILTHKCLTLHYSTPRCTLMYSSLPCVASVCSHTAESVKSMTITNKGTFQAQQLVSLTFLHVKLATGPFHFQHFNPYSGRA